MGAQGLRCLNRYPSVLPGLAVAKTKTHHRDGTGCWGREMSKAGIRKRGGKEGNEGRKRKKEREKVEWGRDKGEMGEIQKSREKERKSKRTTKQGGIPKKGGEKREVST